MEAIDWTLRRRQLKQGCFGDELLVGVAGSQVPLFWNGGLVV